MRSRGMGAVSACGGRGEALGATHLWERPLHASGSQSAKLWESPSAATFKHSAANKVRVSDCSTPERVRFGPRRAACAELSGARRVHRWGCRLRWMEHCGRESTT